MTADREAVVETALRIAAAGWPVFPCVPDGKRPLTSHGLLDATVDADRIRAWWRRTPDANLAIPTGTATVDVLDVDVRSTGSGYPSFNRLAREGMLAGHSRVIATPSGGLHVYFTGTAQACSRLPEQHLDFKASGGYVLVPPSVVDSRAYEVVRRTTGPHRPLEWAAVRALLSPPPTVTPPRYAREEPGIAALATWVATLPEGRRNDGTFWAACRAVEQGVTDLKPLVDAAVVAGLSELEARRTVTSAARRVQVGPPTASPRPRTTGRRARGGP